MLKQEAKRQIVKDWLALPPSERETPNQALLFVTKWRQRHSWRTSSDPHQDAMGWLSSYIRKQ
jgi:hypothetical protein